MQSPLDKYIVEVDKRYQDEITHGSLKLYLDTTYQPEWHATIRGKVVGCPRKISKKDPFKSCIIPEVQVGDEVLFSYLVVFDRDFIKDPEYFVDHSDGNPFVKEYVDGYKNTLRITKLPGMYAGVLIDRDEELLDGVSGSEALVEQWMTGFKFSNESDLVYCNLILDEQERWMADIGWIFAKKSDSGWDMVGGYVLMEPLEVIVENKAGLIIPDYLKTQVDQQRARVVSIGSPLKDQPRIDVKKGDIVYIDYSRCEKYEIDGKKYLITTQKRILGK